MGRPYSLDLRKRVVAAVKTGGFVPSGCGPIWRWHQHCDQLGAALARDRERPARPVGRA
jgi:hypothetical protein